MNPIPLTDPEGEIRAWMCSNCCHVNTGTDLVHKQMTQNCCICRECEVNVKLKGEWACADCNPEFKKKMAERWQAFEVDQEAYKTKFNECLKKSTNAVAAKALRTLMSEISEKYYCAGWLMGLEYQLWSMVLGGNKEFGLGEVKDSEIQELKELSAKCGGWFYWNDREHGTASGELFITTDEWQEMYKDGRHASLLEITT